MVQILACLNLGAPGISTQIYIFRYFSSLLIYAQRLDSILSERYKRYKHSHIDRKRSNISTDVGFRVHGYL